MNKIIEFALSTKFGKDIEAIMEVIAATENPTVASEILLGLYEEPEIAYKNAILANQQDNKIDIEYQCYDRFKDEVTFRYHRVIRKEAWFKKGDMPHKDHIASDRHWTEDAAKQLGLSVDEFKETHERVAYHTEIESSYSTTKKSARDWNEYTEKCEVIPYEEDVIDLATLADQQTEAMLP